jgi:hypothetical protein
VAGRRAEEGEDKDEDEDEEVELPIPGSFDIEDQENRCCACRYRRSIRCGRHARELVVAHAGDVMVRTRKTFHSFRISSHLEPMYVYCIDTGSIIFFIWFPLVSVWS